MRAEPGGDGPVEEEGSRDPPPAVRGDLGALRRDPVPPQRHREPAGTPHLRHGHAAEHVQVRAPAASHCKQRDKRTSYLTQMASERSAPGSDWHSAIFLNCPFVFLLVSFFFCSCWLSVPR